MKSMEKEGHENFEEIARENFSRWNNELQTKDSKSVSSLYSTDASFLPTVSGEFKKGQNGAGEYFEHFLEKNPNGEIVDEMVQALSPNSYVHSGMYNFEVDGENGGRKVVEARFTFVWQKDSSGEWKIIHHHSSMRPER